MHLARTGSNPLARETRRNQNREAPAAAAAPVLGGGGARARASSQGLLRPHHTTHIQPHSNFFCIILQRHGKKTLSCLFAALANSSSISPREVIKVSTSKFLHFVFVSSTSSMSSRSIMLVFVFLVTVFSFEGRPLFFEADLGIFPSFFTSKIFFPLENSLHEIWVPISFSSLSL